MTVGVVKVIGAILMVLGVVFIIQQAIPEAVVEDWARDVEREEQPRLAQDLDAARAEIREMRWQRYFDKATILADARAQMRVIYADDMFDNVERSEWCWKTDIWQKDLEDIQDYMANYVKAEPEMVRANVALQELASEAEVWERRARQLYERCQGR